MSSVSVANVSPTSSSQSAAITQALIVDDVDPGIQYYGVWVAATTQNNTGSFGSPSQSTLHELLSDIGTFDYSFNGTQILVRGSNGPYGINYTTDYPTWQCTIDNDASLIVSFPPPINSGNDWVLCAGQFPDGLHTLTVKAWVINQKSLWFDLLEIVPSTNVTLSQFAPLVTDSSSTDGTLVYSPGWNTYSNDSFPPEYFGTITYTQQTGASFTFTFSGTNITVYGMKGLPMQPECGPPKNAQATYAIDGQPAVPFSVADPDNPDLSFAIGESLFQVGQLAPGPHTLEVVYLGNNSNNTAPLAITSLFQNALPPVPSSSTTIHRKPILRGVIGMLVLFSLLLNIWPSYVL